MKNINHFKKLIALPLFVAAMGASSAVFGQYGDSPARPEQVATKQYSDDAKITKEVKTDILEDTTLKGPQVSVETMRGVVYLSGSVDSQKSKTKAVEIAENVQGVTSVKNDLIIR